MAAPLANLVSIFKGTACNTLRWCASFVAFYDVWIDLPEFTKSGPQFRIHAVKRIDESICHVLNMHGTWKVTVLAGRDDQCFERQVSLWLETRRGHICADLSEVAGQS